MLDFFKRLLPNVEKRNLLSQFDTTEQRIKDILFPLTASIDATLNGEYKSEYAKNMQKTLQRRLSRYLTSGDMESFISITAAVNQNVLNKLALLRKHVDTLFGNVTISSGLTFKQLEVIRLIDLTNFYVTYAVKLIHYSVWEELAKRGVITDKPLTEAEIKWLSNNESGFAQVCEVFSYPDNQFDKAVKETSELIINEAGDNISVLGTRADPLKLGLCPGIGSAILFIRESALAREADKYEANKLRLQSVQLQLQLLNEKLENTTDESEKKVLINQINYHTKRIKGLEYDIHKFEEKAGVA